MWVLYHSPSLSLLQLLTESQQGQAAMLCAGEVLSRLLSDPQQQELALQLLDSSVSRGRGKQKPSAGRKPAGVRIKEFNVIVKMLVFQLLKQQGGCIDPHSAHSQRVETN